MTDSGKTLLPADSGPWRAPDNQSEQLPDLAQLLEDAMIPMAVIGHESKTILYLNSAAVSFFRAERSQLVGAVITRFWVDPRQREKFLSEINAKGKVVDFETQLRTLDGQCRHVAISSTHAVFGGEPAIHSIFKDITLQKETAEARRQSEERYHELYNMLRLMADTVPDMIWAKDINDNFLFANRAICNTLLMCDDASEPIGKNDLFFARRERERGHNHTFGEICLNSDEVVKETGKPGRFLEDGLIRGKYLMLDVHKAPMFDANGTIIGTVGAGRDITRDMKNIEEKRASDKRYRLLAENVRDVIWTMDGDLKFTYISPSVKDILGYTQHELLKIDALATIFPKKSIYYFRRFLSTYQNFSDRQHDSRELHFWEFEMFHANGSLIWIETVTSPMLDEQGDFCGVVGVSRDVTSRVETQHELEKTKEQALAASRAKSEFLANMSHEIRTPMNGILGMLQLLQATRVDDRQKEYIDTAIQSGTNLLQLITDILDFSKIEAGKIELTEQYFDLHLFLQTINTAFSGLIDPSRVAITFTLSPNLPRVIKADKSRLQQILFNLLGNSVKFTTNGRIGLTASARAAEDNGLLLTFVLEDTGIGIPKNVLPQLFEPFVQADGSFQRKYSGTGLGLSIVRQLVTLMGGAIELHSTPGKGTRAEFSILAQPGNSMAADPARHSTVSSSKSATGTAGARILVVEDEKINAMVICAMLGNLGYRVTQAMSGSEAIELARLSSFDCILMDIQMPEMDGIEAAANIRQHCREHNGTTPIIAVTAHAMKGDRENFLAAGMDDYITKPVDAKALATTLERALGRTAPGG